MMQLEDLEHIFKPQIAEGTVILYYMLVEGEHKLVERCPSDQLESLLPMLDNFVYTGTEARIPRFTK